jgi:hypothetical protein
MNDFNFLFRTIQQKLEQGFRAKSLGQASPTLPPYRTTKKQKGGSNIFPAPGAQCVYFRRLKTLVVRASELSSNFQIKFNFTNRNKITKKWVVRKTALSLSLSLSFLCEQFDVDVDFALHMRNPIRERRQGFVGAQRGNSSEHGSRHVLQRLCISFFTQLSDRLPLQTSLTSFVKRCGFSMVFDVLRV